MTALKALARWLGVFLLACGFAAFAIAMLGLIYDACVMVYWTFFVTKTAFSDLPVSFSLTIGIPLLLLAAGSGAIGAGLAAIGGAFDQPPARGRVSRRTVMGIAACGLAAALLALAVKPDLAGWTAERLARSERFVVTVSWVIDGDTFEADGHGRIRLWGIAAPELDEPGGHAARRALAALLPTGIAIACEQRDVDRYGRTVAVCYDGRLDIGRQLVVDGYASDCPRFSGEAYADVSKNAYPLPPYCNRVKRRS